MRWLSDPLPFHHRLISRSSLLRMANGSLCAWCSAVVFALALLRVDGYLVDITYVESAAAKGAGICCLFMLR